MSNTDRQPHYVQVNIWPRPVMVEVDADTLAEVFADTNDKAQAAILQSIATRLKRHPTQRDAIACELAEEDRADALQLLRDLVTEADAYIAERSAP